MTQLYKLSNTGMIISPAWRLRINDRKLYAKESSYFLEVRYTDAVDGLNMCEFKISIFDTMNNRIVLLDEGTFELGAKITLEMGYGSDLKEMMTGEIVTLTPNFSLEQSRTMLVRVYDKGHRLTQGKKVRNFVGLKDSEIVEKIVREAGLKPRVDDTGTVIPQVIQNNLTDMEFIRQRARRYGYVAFTEKDTFNFVKERLNTPPIAKMVFAKDFSEFKPKMSLSETITEVEVRGWDDRNKQEIKGTALKGTEEARMKGKQTASQVNSSVFGEEKVIVTNINIYNALQSQKYAKSILNNRSASLIEGKLYLDGNNQFKAGKIIELSGLTKSFNGSYYISSSLHTIDSRGYNTVLDLRRNSK